jgi:transcriptional/translational regulatory protein YebC/TACO1
MNINARVERAERQLGLEGGTEPFILIVSARPHEGDPEYEARLRERIEKAKREHAGEAFWLLLG